MRRSPQRNARAPCRRRQARAPLTTTAAQTLPVPTGPPSCRAPSRRARSRAGAASSAHLTRHGTGTDRHAAPIEIAVAPLRDGGITPLPRRLFLPTLPEDGVRLVFARVHLHRGRRPPRRATRPSGVAVTEAVLIAAAHVRVEQARPVLKVRVRRIVP